MWALFKTEVKRAACNPLFLVVFLVANLIGVYQIMSSVIPSLAMQGARPDVYPLSVFNSWIGGEGHTLGATLYFFLLPLLVCVPFSDSLFMDLKTGYVKNLLIRTKRRNYYFGKLGALFVVGASIAAVPLLLNFLVTTTLAPYLTPEPSAGTFPLFASALWADLFYSHPTVYVGLYLGLIGLFGGLLAALPLVFTSILSNRFMVLLSTFVVCVALNFLTASGSFFEKISPIQFLRPDQPYTHNNHWLIISMFLILFLTIIIYAMMKARSDELN